MKNTAKTENTTQPRIQRQPYGFGLSEMRRWLRNKRRSKMPMDTFRAVIRAVIAALRVLKKSAKVQMRCLPLKDKRPLPPSLAHLRNTTLPQLKAKWRDAQEKIQLLNSALASAS
jgi:hypothetical protein